MSKLWSDFYDQVLPLVPGLPPGAPADEVIRDSAIEFCELTKCWEFDVPAIDVVGGTPSYSISPGAGKVCVEIKRATFGGKVIVSRTEAELDGWISTWREDQGEVAYYTQPNEEDIRLVLTPASSLSGGLVIKLIVAPSADSTEVPDSIWSQHRRAIAIGAIARAMLSPKKPYTNLQLGAVRMQDFYAACGRLSGAIARAYGRRPLRTRTIHGID